MTKYFGTDGLRGDAGGSLTVEMALKVGSYLGHTHKGQKIVVGQDTRISSDMFANAIAAGASAMGADVYILGVCATPALAYIVKHNGFAGGVMISASHNPFYDNGLKVFSNDGTKIPAELEDRIEDYIDGKVTLEDAKAEQIGRIVDYKEAMTEYIDHVMDLVDVRFEGLKIVLDVANGSAVSSATQAFKTLGAEVITLHNSPDGININTECGSTHPESLMAAVLEHKADLGFAFDGDADRCLAVNHKGELVDGDAILYIFGQYLKEKGMLNHDTVVTTVMANLGFMKACKNVGLNVEVTDVGDKYVYARMFEEDFKLGGEQSGHIILKDYATTGDGLLTALVLTEVVVKRQASLEALYDGFVQFPQVLKNLRVKDKNAVLTDGNVDEAVKNAEKALGEDGRILVRPSGTEPLIRVMVEAPTEAICNQHVEAIIAVIQSIQ